MRYLLQHSEEHYSGLSCKTAESKLDGKVAHTNVVVTDAMDEAIGEIALAAPVHDID